MLKKKPLLKEVDQFVQIDVSMAKFMCASAFQVWLESKEGKTDDILTC